MLHSRKAVLRAWSCMVESWKGFQKSSTTSERMCTRMEHLLKPRGRVFSFPSTISVLQVWRSPHSPGLQVLRLRTAWQRRFISQASWNSDLRTTTATKCTGAQRSSRCLSTLAERRWRLSRHTCRVVTFSKMSLQQTTDYAFDRKIFSNMANKETIQAAHEWTLFPRLDCVLRT